MPKAKILIPVLPSTIECKIELVELTGKMCHWIEGRHYCGQRISRGSFCEHHAAIAYTKATPRKGGFRLADLSIRAAAGGA